MDFSNFLDRLEDVTRTDKSLNIVRYTNENVPAESLMEALSQALEVAFQIKEYDYDWLSHQLNSPDLVASTEWKISTVRAIYKTATQFEKPFLGSKLRIPGVELADMELRDDSDRFSLGSPVGSYTILDKIGQGGALIVYRGVNLDAQKSVTIRVPRHFGERDKAFLDNLRREFRVLQDLASKNLPGVQRQIEWFELEGVPISVCEYIEGETLSKLNHLVKDPLEALEIVAQAAEVVHRVHECGHIHGDIKLDNLIRSDDGTLTLIDFNVSLPLDPTIDRSPPYSGTLSSMGLESIAGAAAEIDVRRDVYSLGALLYEITEKKTLIRGSSREDAFVALAILPIKDEPIFSESTPPAIRSIVEFAISRDVNNRFENCHDLSDACRDAKSNLHEEIHPKRNLNFLIFRIGRSVGEMTRRVRVLLPLSQRIAEQGGTKGMAKSEYFEILGFSSLGEERRNITVLSNQASFDVPDPDPSDFFGAVVMRIGRANKEYLSEIVERLTQVENWCNETSNYLRSRLEGQQTAKGLFELGLLVGHHRESIAAQVSFQRLKDEFGLTELCTVAIDTLSDQRIADVATRMKCCEDQVGIWLQNAEK